MAFSNSYGLRGYGSDALYWNPALLSEGHRSFDIPITTLDFSVNNNALSLHTYNDVSGQYIDDALKKEILSSFQGHLSFETDVHSTILGTSFGHSGLGIGLNAVGSARLSKRYLNLLLYGNNGDEVINFTKKHTGGEGLAYADITFGSGNYEITKHIPSYADKGLPPVKFGFALSLLTGIKDFQVTDFNGRFSTGDDGIDLVQDITMREGTVGFGYKGLIGFTSTPMKNLEVGLTIDNIAGKINWSNKNKNHEIHMEADSIYIADLNEDLVDQTDTTYTTGDYTTEMPAEFNISSLYHLGKASFSLDWKQGFKESVVTTKQPRISLGAEYILGKIIPLQIGYSLPNANESYKFSYGLGVRSNHFEMGMAFQSSHAVIPCLLSRGFTFSLHSRILY